MPHNRKEGLDAIYQAILTYNHKKEREVLLGYVLMRGVNDTLEHAENLVSFTQGLRVKINLIPYNPIREISWETPSEEQMTRFRRTLEKSGVRSTFRKTAGQEVEAACGQLRLDRSEA